MSDDPEASLASTRSRRGPSSKKSKREEALAKLKARQNKEVRYEVEEETDNVYDVVDEKEYAKKVEGRLQDDFIVDDDGNYADDGREIFDEDDEEETGKDRSGPRKKRKVKEEEAKKKRGNIKNMLLNMKGKKNETKSAGIEGDEVLESLLGEIKSKPGPSSGGLKRPRSAVQAPKRNNLDSKPVIAPVRSGISRPKAKPARLRRRRKTFRKRSRWKSTPMPTRMSFKTTTL